MIFQQASLGRGVRESGTVRYFLRPTLRTLSYRTGLNKLQAQPRFKRQLNRSKYLLEELQGLIEKVENYHKFTKIDAFLVWFLHDGFCQ